jgi:drug/metabolite transporter (DMT)-like permease
MAMEALGDAMALGCALAWAFAVLAFRRVEGVPASALNLFKNTLATALLLPTLAIAGVGIDLDRSALDWGLLVTSGVLGLALADTLFLAGLARIDASIAAVADCAYAPTVLLLSVLWLHEPTGLGLWLGGPLVLVGLLVVSWQPRRAAGLPGTGRPIDRVGVLLAVAGVMTTALGVVLAKPALAHCPLLEATTIRLAAGSAALFAVQALRGRAREVTSLFRPQAAWRYAIPGAVLGSYVAMILWLGGMKYGTASRAALLNQSGAVFVLVLSRLAGEPVPLRRWVGAFIAVAGVVVVLVA